MNKHPVVVGVKDQQPSAVQFAVEAAKARGVGLRVVHSIVQSTINIVPIRFAIFFLATFCLLGLTVHAGLRILHDCFG